MNTKTLLKVMYPFFAIVLLCVSLENCVHANKYDPLSEYEKILISNYANNMIDKDAAKSDAINYVRYTIQVRNSLHKKNNALIMVQSLDIKDRIEMEDDIINFSINLIKQIDTLNDVEEYEDVNGIQISISFRELVGHCLHVLSEMRTEESLNYLKNLIKPYREWDSDIFEGLLNDVNQSSKGKFVLNDIRMKSFGALFQPIDQKGENMINEIEVMINNFSENDPVKTHLQRRMEIWKKIYSGELDINRYTY